MIELTARTPFDGLLPIEAGALRLSEAAPARMTSLAPYRGRDKALSEALKAAHGMAFPAPNRATGREGARAVWFGQRMALLIGPEPDAGLTEFAALTDQSDAWAVARLEGEGAAEALARLAPLDLREGAFKRGHTARTELGHMHASLTRISGESWRIMVFRAFARTLAHEMREAMQSVAARAGV
ncbi:sarcosine oxidase subunit gamma [Roseovarius spongiae]|uniref:Sarcosine oxidase subunit gamma n=1 Tax=Roseovarius spongiae TaxID=2320272 RepID=A0A3A8AXH2_9RHOB|nr:sarcosine oxidase subunit gamma [Roseovarius spongiae]RKF16537.1 sarcosine oxidase subunit gamma [Roseovarius spongiae]